ncbi:MAG: hypothetical protein FJ147_01300 [Deltaproteobacteria bacterium]|nr:hypothetical protein [Deltaproteobacteria bacterium]
MEFLLPRYCCRSGVYLHHEVQSQALDNWIPIGIWINTIALIAASVATVISLRRIAEVLNRVEETAARGERMTAEVLTRLTSSTAQ